MRTFAFTAIIASLAAFASAAPTEKRGIDSASITFYTPSGEKWSQTFPTDQSSVEIDSVKTVAHAYNPGGSYCIFSGTQGESLSVPIGEHKLKTPQPLKSGFCADL
ncbi:hypothetical protein FQN54_001224 [Arachnomyces sp. PD_36]|nr:hypothetical protein FQN54_001224 [Arachnomyces sp. PD_36]